MGNKDSRCSSPEFLLACRRFTQSELEDLQKLFKSLAFQSRSNGEYISASVFQAYYGIHGSLGSRLFDLVSRSRKDKKIYYEDLVESKAIYEKGSPDELENFIYKLVDLLGDGLVQRTEAEAVVLSIIETVLGPKDAVPGVDLPESSIQGFVDSAEFSVQTEGEPCMSSDDFRKWCLLIPSIKKFLSGLMTPTSAGTYAYQVPKLRAPEGICSVLRKEFAWHISGALQQIETEEWMLLYHSSRDGFSFNTFIERVSGAGSSIFLIRDQDGYVFGGYASQAWERHPDFFGDLKSFLFTLQPKTALYRPSGVNSNLQWCAANYTSDSIPNGIGFGGQKNHFAVFMPSNFDHGYSYSSVTYNNPPLSKKAKFGIDVIECWAMVLESNKDSKKPGKSEGTILQRFKEDRNMLNMVGIANASDSAS